ncbi:MAG: glycosyltransferase [Pseudonocardiales bacterium]
MRILFTFAGGSGHAEPLVPVALAARAAGHTVAFAGGASATASLRDRGFATFNDPDLSSAGLATIAPLVEVDLAHEDAVLRDFYAGRSARARAASVLALCTRWSPAVIVCDEVDFGAMIAAERTGVPHATVLVNASGSLVRAELVSERLNELRAEHGLAADPRLAMLSRHLVLSPFAPSFRHPAAPLPATAHSFRPASTADNPGDPGWRRALPAARTIYFTLGTVFNMESGDLFTRALTGLRELPVNLIVTVGRELEPSLFGQQPANVHIASYLPQGDVLPHCDLVVSHGGSGTLCATLTAGLPSVLLPMGADQPGNAARCTELGLGLALDALHCTPGDIRAAAAGVLRTPGYRLAAERVRDEVARLPGPESTVPLLAGLVHEGRCRPSDDATHPGRESDAL